MLKYSVLAVLLLAGPRSWADPTDPFEEVSAAFKRGDHATSLKILRPLAAQGNAKAQHSLGVAYQLGQGVAIDYAEALKWYRLSAAQGYADGQVSMGYMYFMGLGVEKDGAEGLKWQRLAAAQGNSTAQFNIGSSYERADRVTEKDLAEAVRWYRLAAMQGNEPAQCDLGQMYYKGQGLKRDLIRAHMWLSLCRSSPNAHLFMSVDTVEKSMTAQQLSAAKTLARECQERQFKSCD